MSKCPNEECHERVGGHQVTLYGEDGRGGIVGDYVSKRFIQWIITVFGIAILYGGFQVWAASNEVPKIEKTDEIQDQQMATAKEDIAVLKSKMDILVYNSDKMIDLLSTIQKDQVKKDAKRSSND